MVDVYAALNPRQVEVLQWIADGCPDGVMTGHAFKTTAIALQGRRLVAVSKRRGTWSATLTDAGRHYLEHGRHPGPSAQPRRPAQRRNPTTGTTTSRASRPPSDKPQRATAMETPHEANARPAVSGAASSTEAAAVPGAVERFIKELQDAGGVLRVDRVTYINARAQGVDYDQLIQAANRAGKVPAGKRIVTTILSWPGMQIRLEPAIPGTQMEARPVPVPTRISAITPPWLSSGTAMNGTNSPNSTYHGHC